MALRAGPDGRATPCARCARGTRPGNVLCFLPGARRDRARAAGAAASAAAPRRGDRRRCTARSTPRRRTRAAAVGARAAIVLATNIAETSLTVPGVTAVDRHRPAEGGALRRRARRSTALELERITRTARSSAPAAPRGSVPDAARRLWDARDRLRPAREPEIQRVDLAGAAARRPGWGGDAATFEWFERRRTAIAWTRRWRCCERLGAIDGGRAHAARPSAAPPAAASAARPRPARRAAAVRSRRGLRAALGASHVDPLARPPRRCDLLPLIDAGRACRRTRGRWPTICSAWPRSAGLGRARRTSTKRRCDGAAGAAIPIAWPGAARPSVSARASSPPGAAPHGARVSGVVERRVAGRARCDQRPRRAHTEALVRMAAAVEPDWIVPTSPRRRASLRRRRRARCARSTWSDTTRSSCASVR